MANKQVKINLLFDANTTAAQSNIQQLAVLLQQISTKTVIGVDSGSLQQAVNAAQQLQISLQNAVNVNTGKIDLMKLQNDLKASGTSLQTLTSQLRAVGPAGEQAFLKVANAISQAEVPMVKANGLIKNFMTTLANTAKWQAASSAIHGMMGMFQSATSHAKNLNKALTDIQIVTHASTTEMAQFAQTATKAASALNTTSTEYAKAALIFYQQGLSGDDVAERANTVIKLSQVTGESASVVSDQMTAIWNNFDNGSHKLEYYADVLTKLGAATAASTDEIADGLEKFAAIAGTVGMEYETAAAAIATVVSETRQSADVVGTAFKTIFARAQGLSLGETLDDGVNLNKYSEALSKVGVDVLTADGKLREMDDILTDLGEKWQGIGEETQVALAQVVGGTRQYSQMIALMDNWDKVVDNIDEAKGATGELAKQQEIWAHSYEASLARLNQAKNELYESFVSDDFLIGWNDTITILIKSIGDFVDKIGGIGPLIFSLVGIFSKTLFPLITSGLTKISNMLAIHTGKAAQQVAAMQSQMSNSISQMVENSNFTNGMKKQLALTAQLLQEKQKLMLASKTMTEAQKIEAQSRLAVAEAMMTETMQILQQQDALEKQARAAQASLISGKQRWDVARTAAEHNYRKRSTEMANPDETEDERLVREANDNWVLNRATNTGAGKLKSQVEAGIQFIQNQQQLQNWAPNIERANQQAATHQPISSKDLSIRDKARNLQAEQAKLLEKMGLTHGDINADVSKYVEGLMKARDIQKEIYEIANNNAEKAGVGTAKIKHDASYGEGEEVGQVESTQLSKISANSEGAISFDETSGNLGMEASLANYEKLYQVLGEQKVLQSELVAATQEVAAAREAAKGKTADYEAATIELVAAEKELANYEKTISKSGKTITDARKAELKQISKGSKEYKKLSKTEKDYVKIQEKIKKAVDNQTEAQKKAITQFTAQKKSYEDLATKAGATSDQMKQLTGAFDALESGSGNVDDQFKAISSVFKQLGISTDGVSNDIIELGNKMQTMLAAAGYSDDQIDILTQAFQKLANTTPQAANGIKGAEGALGSLNNKAPTLTSSFGSMAQNAMTLAGNLMSLKSGIEGITAAFTEGGSAADIMQGVLTGIMGIMPTIIAITNAAKDAQDRKNKSTSEGVRADIAKTASEGVKTGATWANTIANIANLLSNPWTMALAAVAVAAIAVVCASMNSKTEATKADTQSNIENAESSNELSVKWVEQQDAMDGLIAKYKDLKAAGEEYQDTVDDIVEAVPDLINAYREAAKGLGIDISEGTAFYEAEQRLKNAAAVGNAEVIEQAQEEMDALIAPEAAKAAKQGYDASVKALGYKLQETEGSFSDNTYTTTVGGYLGFFDTVQNSEETIAENILKEKMGSKYDTNAVTWEDVGGNISLDMSTSDQFVEDYEALLAARDEMKAKMTTEDLANSGIYEEVNNLIESTKEEYDKVKEMLAEAQKYGVYNAKANLEAQGMDITEIDSLQEYHDYKAALLNDKNIKGDPEAEAIAQQWLEANASVQDYILAEQKIGFIKDQTGNDLTAFYDTLKPDEKELFLNVDFNKYQSEEAITAEIHRLQKVAEQNDIKVKIKAIDTTKEAVKKALKDKALTEDDWVQIRDSGIEWGKDGIIKFTEFLKMSYEEQSQYLQRIKDEQDSLLKTSTEQTIDTLKQDLVTLASAFASGKYTGDLAQYTAERQAILDEIELLQGEAIIRNKMVESQEIARHELDESLIAELKEEFDVINSEMQILNEASGQVTKATLSIEDLNEANKDAAIRYARLNAAVDDLNSNYETYEAILKDFSKAATDADKAMIANSEDGKALKKSIAGLLNVTEDFIDVDLLEAIDPKDFKKAAEGDEDAIERIRSAFIKLQAEIHDIDFDKLKTELDELQEGIIIDIRADTMPLLYELIAAKVAAGAGAQEIEDLLSGFNIDADVSDFIGSMDEMAKASAKAGTEVIANTSFSQEVEPTTVETIEPQEEIAYSTTYEPDTVSFTNKILKNGADDVVEVEETRTNLNKKVEATPVPGESVSTTTATTVTTSNAAGETGKIKGVQIKNAHRSSGGKVSGNRQGRSVSSGGSSSKPKKTSEARKDKSETVERYKEINDQLDDSSKALDKASKAADRLYGADRLKAMDKVNKALEKEIKNLKIKKKEAEEYLAIDKKALEEAAADMNLGINFEYDEKGNIINYEEQMSKVHDAREAMLDSFGSTIDEKEQEKLDSFDEKVSNLTDKQKQYDDTREEKEDIEEQIDDSYEQWQDNNYEKLKYKLELKVEINDQDLQMIEFELSQIEDDVFKQAEAAAIMAGDSTSQTGKSKYDIYKQTADDLKAQKDALDEKFAKKEISQADYISGLKEIYSDTISNMQALQELDRTMQEYYGNTLNMAAEEIAKYTESMEHQTSVLDHYSSLLEIMGKSNDYEAMGTVLEAKAKTLEDQVAVSKSAMEMYQTQAADRYQKWKDAEARGDDAAAEILKKEYEAALKAAETAEDEFLSKSEEWAESLKAVLENSLKDAAKDLEKALTGGTSFDTLTTRMERASSLQEEYLTTTNKIYETNKMINTAQQAIDKTTNTVAKQRLANFQKETAQLQNKKKLSQYELDIQQAKYDLLLAEIALEEAQNAKSTVRLQRDSEGNFGYVYTADQNQVADAQQKMLDAENALYNKGLKGANDYAQKYQQTMQEMYDALTEIQDKYLNGEYASYQEYQDAMIEAQDYYYQKLEDYSDLYKVAISADNKVIADAWSSNFNDMVFNTEQWKIDVAGYVGEVSKAFGQWKTDLDNLKLKTELDDLAGKTKGITDESKNLRIALIGEDGKGGVVGALDQELTKVGNVTTAYGNNREALKKLIEKEKEYAEAIKGTVEEQSKRSAETSPKPPTETKNQGKTSVGDNESDKVKTGGSGDDDDTRKNPPPTPPEDPSIKVYAHSVDTGRGAIATVKASEFRSVLSRPYGSNPVMFQGTYYNGQIGYMTQQDYQRYKTYKNEKEIYDKKIASLDTGGYTGSWGNEGKLAMLHQKELVLNADDTTNFLTSLEVLKEIMNVIDLHSAHAQLVNAISSPMYRDYTEPQVLEQQVHIEATFPGVQDRNEIEEAFNNLLNRATQYVSRK